VGKGGDDLIGLAEFWSRIKRVSGEGGEYSFLRFKV